MIKNENVLSLGGWLFGLLNATIGILNLIQVHPVPGMVYLLLALIFFPPVNKALMKILGFRIPLAVKIFLGVVIIWFTLGVSDLAEIYGL